MTKIPKIPGLFQYLFCWNLRNLFAESSSKTFASCAEDEAEDEGEGELEDEGEDEAEDEDEEQLRPLSAATVAALRKRIRSLPKLRMRNSSQYREILKFRSLLSTSRAEAARQRARAGALAEAA